jgi:hypothetical protein
MGLAHVLGQSRLSTEFVRTRLRRVDLVASSRAHINEMKGPVGSGGTGVEIRRVAGRRRPLTMLR